jgi:hypothetical protein
MSMNVSGRPCHFRRGAAAILTGLVSDAGMRPAIGFSRPGACAAEPKFRCGRVAQRPAAHGFTQFHNSDAFGNGNNDIRRGTHIYLRFIHRLHGQSCISAGLRHRPRHLRTFGRFRCNTAPGHGCHGQFITSGKAQTVHLSDNGVAGYRMAQFGSNLAGAMAVKPKFFQKFNALVCPGH